MRCLFTVESVPLSGPTATRSDVLFEGAADVPASSLLALLDGAGEPGGAGGAGEPGQWWDGDRPISASDRVGNAIRDGAVLSPHARPAAPAVDQVGELRIVGGPHAGERFALGLGHHIIGRSDDAEVNLVRDLKVSRRHAVLTVAADGVRIQDDGSAHGTILDGRAVSTAELPPGAILELGDTAASWSASPGIAGRAAERERAVVVPDGEGGVLFNRPPRMMSPAAPTIIRFPGEPPIRQGVNFPLMMSVAPVVLGVVLALLYHQVQFLLFTLLSPMMAVSNYVSQRRGGVRSHRERLALHRQATERAEAELNAAVAGETARRRDEFPDPATLSAIASGPTGRLWERRRDDEDFLKLRAGIGDLPASATVEGSGPAGGRPETFHGPQTPQTPQTPRLAQVPVVVDLARDGVLGIAGDRDSCESLARALLLQVAVLHSPEDVVITVLSGAHQEEAWGWAKWLPHCRDRVGRSVARIATTDAALTRLAGELAALVDERTNQSRRSGTATANRPSEPAHVVVVDGSYRLGGIPAVTRLLRHGSPAGISLICLDDAERLLPEECRAVASFRAEIATEIGLRTGRSAEVTPVKADLVAAAPAESIARALAPLRLNRRAAGETAVPTSLRLLDLINMEPPTPSPVLHAWGMGGRSTKATIGASATGPFLVDLSRDGPHGLVAGTTGSGKSELLQTLIASLAVVNRPDSMNFVLIDYKGGSAFKDCARLPHTVGMVTDLDGHLTERALTSLAAEVRRREALLARLGAKDVEGYWRAAGAEAPSLARLVIIIDEFAALVEELPDFVDGLVDLARRGRSLGIHLILATQRPSGVVSAAIKTNTNLRVAMRVTDSADSVDVIDSPLAAHVSKNSPGRGYLRVGHEDLTEFQVARAGGRRPGPGLPEAELHRVTWQDLAEPRPEPARPAASSEATDLSELVAAIRAAAASIEVAPARSPWLDPLPTRLSLRSAALDAEPSRGLGAPFGVEDHPASQERRVARLDLERDGHLLFVGDPGSGRTTTLRTIAASLGARTSPADVHIYAIDCGNGALGPVAELPHCGAVVFRREADRVDRLIGRLTADVAGRQQALARGGFATITDQWAAVATNDGDRLPYIVLLIDRWEGFTAEFETVDNGRLVTAIQQLMREGPGAGLRVVVTGDRSAMSPRFSSLVDRILMLRLNDRSTYAMGGLNPRHLPDVIPPGRAFDARTGIETQVALLDDDPSGPAQVAGLNRIAGAAAQKYRDLRDGALPDPVAVLPPVVSLSSLLSHPVSAADAGDRRPVALVGVGGDRLVAQWVDLTETGPCMVVSGPPRSGRSNALVVMARTLLANGCRVLAVTARRSPLTALGETDGEFAAVDGRSFSPGEIQAYIDGEPGPLAVLVDDAELLSDSPISEPLAAFARTARDRAGALIIAGTAGELGAFRGFVAEARKSRTGLLLCPSGPGDGEVVGARLARTAVFAGPPGRGVLLAGAAMDVVQVPLDDQAG